METKYCVLQTLEDKFNRVTIASQGLPFTEIIVPKLFCIQTTPVEKIRYAPEQPANIVIGTNKKVLDILGIDECFHSKETPVWSSPTNVLKIDGDNYILFEFKKTELVDK